jgi:hypothetical protein
MTDDELALRNAIITVLSSGPIWKIDFWLGPVHVDGAGLFMVVWALTWNMIDVKIGSTSAGASAEYHPADNQFVFPFKSTSLSRDQKMLIVHESVHAMLDIRAGLDRKNFHVLQTENEAAAYIAQAIFGIHAFNLTAGRNVSAYFEKAFEIAEKIKDQRGAHVSNEDAQYIRHAIAVSNTYYKRFTETTPATSDGLW